MELSSQFKCLRSVVNIFIHYNRHMIIFATLYLQSAELEDWDDSTGAWEDEDLNLDTDQVMRQTRKQERERRLAEHQKRNQDREHRKLTKDNSLLGTKIS